MTLAPKARRLPITGYYSICVMSKKLKRLGPESNWRSRVCSPEPKSTRPPNQITILIFHARFETGPEFSERLELSTSSFVAKYSVPLSYENIFNIAGEAGFEPTILVFQD